MGGTVYEEAIARSASPAGSSDGSRRQNGISRPPASRAHASTRSLGTRYAGRRSGSWSGKTHARASGLTSSSAAIS